MPASPAEAIGPAFVRTAKICFQPFDIKKWFIMGFCAFLATCGERGANVRLPNFGSSSPGPGAPGPTPADIQQFILDHLPLIIAGAVAGLLLFLALYIALMYLRCRGRFMFLDNIVMNRAAVIDPWKRLAPQAYSYFKFCLLLMIYYLAVFLGSIALGVIIATPDIVAGKFTAFSVAGIAFGLALMLPLLIYIGLVGFFAQDFVLPIMLVRNTTFRPAWEEARAVLVRGNIGSLILFYFLDIVLGIASFIVGLVAVLLTCCIGGLPYLSSVLLLPLLVFHRVYPLVYLEQFGPAYRLGKPWPASAEGFPIEPDPPAYT